MSLPVRTSIKTHLSAPRLTASRPRAPVPAKMSNTRVSAKDLPAANILNRLSRVLSKVGLVSMPRGDFNVRPPALPEIILT